MTLFIIGLVIGILVGVFGLGMCTAADEPHYGLVNTAYDCLSKAVICEDAKESGKLVAKAIVCLERALED